jgi:hypothetical protein
MVERLSLVLVILALSACTATVRPQPTKIEMPGVDVTVGGSGGGAFCPPGQAKKGRC